MSNDLSDVKITETPDGVLIPVKAKPNGRSNAIGGVFDGALKISVTATPEKGKANRALIKLLAKSLGIPQADIELVSGSNQSQKKFLIRGLDIDRVRSRLG